MSTRTLRLSLLFSCAVLLAGAGSWQACCAAQTIEITEPYHAPWEESKKLTRALERTVEFPGIADREAKLGDVLDRLAKKYDLSFLVTAGAFKAADLDDVMKTKIAEEAAIQPVKATLGTVLKKILGRVSGTSPAIFLIRRDTIEITTGAAWLRELGLSEETDFNNLVKQQFRKVELRRALEEIGGGSVLIDIRVEKKTRTKVSARLWYVPAETAVELLADMAGLAVVFRDGVTYVTSPDNAARMKKAMAARKLAPTDQGSMFFRTGLRDIEYTRPGITLRGALEAVGEEGGVNLLIDPRVEKKLRVRVTNRLVLLSTEALLDLLADMAGLAVVKKSNVYYVTSPSNADRIRKENLNRAGKTDAPPAR